MIIENRSVYAVCDELGQWSTLGKAFNRRVRRDFAEDAEKTCNAASKFISSQILYGAGPQKAFNFRVRRGFAENAEKNYDAAAKFIS
jgi:hypothetical protein